MPKREVLERDAHVCLGLANVIKAAYKTLPPESEPIPQLDPLSGADALAGKRGADTLTGGSGGDSFSGGPGTDTTIDVSPAQGDTQDGSIP